MTERTAEDSIDVAWAEAEAAMPPGWSGLTVRQLPFVVGQCLAQVLDDDYNDLSAYAATPAAALRALAAQLRESSR